MKRLSILLVLVMANGCMLLPHDPEMKFPSDIAATCHGCKNDAKRLIESKGRKLKERWNCRVHKMMGEKKFSGVWAWKDKDSGMYICGSCGGSQIWIAVNPNNTQDLHGPTLTHEFAHYWLMSNFGDYSHNPLLDDVIFNWKHAREVTGWSTATTNSIKELYDASPEGTVIPFSTEKDGKRIHYDFIVIKE